MPSDRGALAYWPGVITEDLKGATSQRVVPHSLSTLRRFPSLVDRGARLASILLRRLVTVPYYQWALA